MACYEGANRNRYEAQPRDVDEDEGRDQNTAPECDERGDLVTARHAAFFTVITDVGTEPSVVDQPVVKPLRAADD